MRLSIDIDEKLLKCIDHEAYLESRTRKWQVEYIIKEWYEQQPDSKTTLDKITKSKEHKKLLSSL